MEYGTTAESAFFGFDNSIDDSNQIFQRPTHSDNTSGGTGSRNDQQRSSVIFVDLFGPGPHNPPVPVLGSTTALNELVAAVDVDRLFVQRVVTAMPADCFPVATHHLEMKGQFPDEDELRAMQHIIMTDDSTPKRQAGRVNAIPPFKSLDLEGVLCVLSDTATRYKIYTKDVLGLPQNPVYRLGVVTMLFDELDRPCFQAQLFHTQEGLAATATIWLYRWCVADDEGGYDEHWRAFGDGRFDCGNLQVQATHIPPPEPATASVKGKKRARELWDIGEKDVDMETVLTPDSLPHQNKSARLEAGKILGDDGNAHNEPNDHLFTDSPDTITGPTILKLARFYSNKELFTKINAGMEAKGYPPLKDENVITRRITVAIASKASRSEDTAVEIRAELNAARLANGVKSRQTMNTKASRDAKKAAKMR